MLGGFYHNEILSIVKINEFTSTFHCVSDLPFAKIKSSPSRVEGWITKSNMLNPMATTKINFDRSYFLNLLVTVMVGGDGWGSVHCTTSCVSVRTRAVGVFELFHRLSEERREKKYTK